MVGKHWPSCVLCVFPSFGSQFVTNYRFSVAAAKASSIMRDSSTSIMDKAVFWIEYTIRHKGAHHLHTAANDLYWFQQHLLDVIAAISLTVAFVSYLSFKCFSYLRKKMCSIKPIAAKNFKSKNKKQ